MKEKMTTFMAMDILNCHLKWINYSVEYIKEHHKSLEHLIEKFEIERDIEGTDAEFLIKDYLFFLEKFIYDTEVLTKTAEDYLKGRGISNVRNAENDIR